MCIDLLKTTEFAILTLKVTQLLQIILKIDMLTWISTFKMNLCITRLSDRLLMVEGFLAHVCVHMENVRANAKVLEFQSFCIFSFILTLFIILIKPFTTKDYERCASGDRGTSGWFCCIQSGHFVFGGYLLKLHASMNCVIKFHKIIVKYILYRFQPSYTLKDIKNERWLHNLKSNSCKSQHNPPPFTTSCLSFAYNNFHIRTETPHHPAIAVEHPHPRYPRIEDSLLSLPPPPGNEMCRQPRVGPDQPTPHLC